MHSATKTTSRGFSLIELLIALGVGVLVLGAAVQLFSKSMAATWIVSQRAELQEDARAASNLVTKDISLAGAGIPTGGVALASGTGTSPVFGCSYNTTCYLGPVGSAAVNYPSQTVGASTIRYMYGVIPGCGKGITVNAAAPATDTITVVYGDNTFLLSDYAVAFNNAAGTSVKFTLPSPAPNPLDQAVNNPAVGLQAGDLVLFQTKLGGGAGSTTGYAVGEVTSPLPAGGGPFNVSFAAADPLSFNQTAATSGGMAQISGGTGTIATRIWVITYYLKMLPDPLGVGAGTPVLMRQVNGRTPVPVAENVVNLQFTYDTYDATGGLLAASCDGGQTAVPPVSPNLIRTINILHMTFRSQLAGVTKAAVGAQAGALTGYQGYDVQTSISARNLSFSQRYQ